MAGKFGTRRTPNTLCRNDYDKPNLLASEIRRIVYRYGKELGVDELTDAIPEPIIYPLRSKTPEERNEAVFNHTLKTTMLTMQVLRAANRRYGYAYTIRDLMTPNRTTYKVEAGYTGYAPGTINQEEYIDCLIWITAKLKKTLDAGHTQDVVISQ